MFTEFSSIIIGDRFSFIFWKLLKKFSRCFQHTFSRSSFEFLCEQISSFPFYIRENNLFTSSSYSHNCISFPVSHFCSCFTFWIVFSSFINHSPIHELIFGWSVMLVSFSFSSEMFSNKFFVHRIHEAVDGVFWEFFTGLKFPPSAYLFGWPGIF